MRIGKHLPLGVILAVSSFAAIDGAALAAGPTCQGGSIKVGAVSTITGPVDFSEVPYAAKAVFDQANAEGGIGGCKISYTIADDKADPAVAAQAARDLIDNQEAVALVGSGSLLDCAVNAPTYKRKEVMSVQGLGVDAACFNSPTIAPVNVGPYTLTTAMGVFATNILKAKHFCAFFSIFGGTQEAYAKGLADWSKTTGQKATLIDMTLPDAGDRTPYLIKARDAGCDAVLTNDVEPGVVEWVKTAEAQKMSGIDWLFLAPGYTEQVAAALAGTTQPVYVGTEWEPYTEQNSPANVEWISTMKKADRPLTAFSQGGYMAAKVFLDVVKGIDGEVTRKSVTAALRGMKPIDFPMSGSPYVFGSAATHSPMQATKVMTLQGSHWKVVTPNWVVLPAVN